jgi:hypothetical protein
MTLLVEPTSPEYSCPFGVHVEFFLQLGGGFPDLMHGCTGEAVSCRDTACGGVFDSGYVQLAGLRAQVHADGVANNTLHCSWLCHPAIGGGW